MDAIPSIEKPPAVIDAGAIAARLHAVDDLGLVIREITRATTRMGLGRLSLIDDVLADRPVLDGRGRRIVEVMLGWPVDLTHWWHGHDHSRAYIDAQQTITARTAFASKLFEEGAALGKIDLQLRERLDLMGWRNAVIVPVHLPQGKTSMVSWVTRQPCVRQIIADHALVLQMFAYKCIDALERLNGTTLPDSLVGLTARQIECIRHAAQGKTVKESAAILKISHYTVAEYLSQASARLHVNSKVQLVATAIRAGIL